MTSDVRVGAQDRVGFDGVPEAFVADEQRFVGGHFLIEDSMAASMVLSAPRFR